jgi:hypothetical protein
MKFVALGLCLLCALLVSVSVYRMGHHATEKTQTSASSVPMASPKMPPQPASGSETALSAGTVVSVTLADPIDSDHDAFGKQYAASVNLVEGQAIAPGSRATVVLVNNNTGWLTQLTGLTVNGRESQVLSGAGSVVAAEQGSKASPSGGILGQIGLAPATAVASNQGVLLPPGSQLRFVLMGNTTAARAVAVSRRYGPAAGTRTEAGLSSAESLASQQEPEFAYLCRATDVPDRTLPISYYLADVFKTSDSQAVVERRWLEFLVTTYPYKFANNRHVNAQCTRMADPVADVDAEVPQNAEIVQTRWHYTLGPPPSPASLPAASTLPSRDTQ